MDIGLDARALIGPKSGIGNYLRQILKAGGFDGHRVLAYYRASHKKSRPELSIPEETEFQWRPLKTPVPVDHLPESIDTLWWVNISLGHQLRTDAVDCFFAPNFIQPPTYTGPSVAVIHDLAHIQAPETHERAYRWYLRLFLWGTIHRADRIITVSEHTKHDLLEYYDIPPETVDVCYGAADERFCPREVSKRQKDELENRYNLPEEFTLFVGNIEPRKNLHRVIEALKRMQPAERPPLVVVGKRHLSYDVLNGSLDEYDGDVVFTGYVPDEDLPILYNLASAFVYPSLYEGFGLPVVEAMQSGTAVLVSDRASLPEVVGDAGIVVDPTDPDAIAKGLAELGEESKATQCAVKALKRAEQFSWRSSAKQINKILDTIA